MERDFLGLGSKFSPVTVKEETIDTSNDSAWNRGGMMEWPVSSKTGSATQFLSFKPSQQDRRRNSVNDHRLLSGALTPTSTPHVFDQNRRSHYNSVQEVRRFPISSQQASVSEPCLQSQFRPGGNRFINSFMNPQPLGGSPIMASPVSVLPAPNSVMGTTSISSSSKAIESPPAQLTIFYDGSVSVYQDISPDKAEAIMLLAGNGLQPKPVPMPEVQKPVYHSPAAIDPSTMPRSFLPSISYTISETGSGSNGVTRPGATKTIASLASTLQNNQTTASNISPAVGLPQSRKASLARFLEKRKDRVVNVSPYYVDNKSSIDCRTPMSECVSSSLSSSSAVRPN